MVTWQPSASARTASVAMMSSASSPGLCIGAQAAHCQIREREAAQYCRSQQALSAQKAGKTLQRETQCQFARCLWQTSSFLCSNIAGRWEYAAAPAAWAVLQWPKLQAAHPRTRKSLTWKVGMRMSSSSSSSFGSAAPISSGIGARCPLYPAYSSCLQRRPTKPSPQDLVYIHQLPLDTLVTPGTAHACGAGHADTSAAISRRCCFAAPDSSNWHLLHAASAAACAAGHEAASTLHCLHPHEHYGCVGLGWEPKTRLKFLAPQAEPPASSTTPRWLGRRGASRSASRTLRKPAGIPGHGMGNDARWRIGYPIALSRDGRTQAWRRACNAGPPRATGKQSQHRA